MKSVVLLKNLSIPNDTRIGFTINQQKMDILSAYCGLDCESCTIHRATLEQDQPLKLYMKEIIVRECSTVYGIYLKIEDITDCDGCLADKGRLFSGCSQCKIRQCAIGKNVESCAFCSDYICDKLQQHFLLDPEAQARLEKIRLQ